MILLDGRRFVAESNSDDGQVGDGTIFEYHQDGDMVWAEYSGGAVRHGHLVGTREANRLDFRYVHLDSEGVTSTGHCTSVIVAGEPLRLHETWSWESRQGQGTSVLRELVD